MPKEPMTSRRTRVSLTYARTLTQTDAEKPSGVAQQSADMDTYDTKAWRNFGRAIVIARNARRWSQRRLAGEAGVSPTSLGALERGEADPLRSRVMPSVAAALGWPLDAAEQFLVGELNASDLERHAALSDESIRHLVHDHDHDHDQDITQLAGEIADLDPYDREAVRDLVRRLRDR